LYLADFWAFLLNEWALVQYAHNMTASVVTASFVVAAAGAYYALQRIHLDQARIYLRVGVIAGFVASVLVAFPTGDRQAKLVAEHQPVTLAAMEGHFETAPYAGLVVIGQPNVRERRLDNPIVVPGFLSLLAYGSIGADVRGLSEFPERDWPDNIELLYYAFHVMAGLGTLFIALMMLTTLQRLRGRLEHTPPLLWTLMFAFPFPFIANTAGWMTAELGRQPWLIYGLMHTSQGYSDVVSPGNVVFTLIGLSGLYFVLGVLYLYLVGREIMHGPGGAHAASPYGDEPVAAEAGRG
jgi:cytochrome d ubiquinol oxidase subunit I